MIFWVHNIMPLKLKCETIPLNNGKYPSISSFQSSFLAMLKVVLDIGYWINNVHKPNKLPANLMRHLQHKLSIWITQNISNLIFFSFKQTNMQILCPSWQGDGDQSQMLKLWVPILLVDFLNASLTSRIFPFQVL